MGSKNLKAVAVRGTGEIPVAHPERVLQINQLVAEGMKNSAWTVPLGTYGTGVATSGSALSGDSPVKNWGGVGVIDYGEDNASKNNSIILEKYKTRKYNCANCPLGCGAEMKYDEGRWPLEATERPEYETFASFGSTILCSEMDAIMKCNEICNIYGFDSISAGMTIAWAMECYNNGILSREDLDGIDLTWGNGAAVVELLQKMADGKGCGAVLANGSAYAAKSWGKGEEYLQTASGIELPMHDPRHSPGLARTYLYDPTPGRHVKGGLGGPQMVAPLNKANYNYEGTGEKDFQLTADTEIMNASSLCYMGKMTIPAEAQNEYIKAITGFEFEADKALATGQRIYLMRQAFNAREGIKPSDMTIANRAIGEPPLQAGPLEGVTVDVHLLGRNFFAAAGIDAETGKPELKTLTKLGHMEAVIYDLY